MKQYTILGRKLKVLWHGEAKSPHRAVSLYKEKNINANDGYYPKTYYIGGMPAVFEYDDLTVVEGLLIKGQ